MTKKILVATAVLSVLFFLLPGRQDSPLASPEPSYAERGTTSASDSDSYSGSAAPVVEFHDWAVHYALAPVERRAEMFEQGRQLARQHRERMKALISADPRRAMEEALPVRWRQELPAEITAIIEKRVNDRGRYAVRGVLGEWSGIHRTFETANGAHYEARVYGRRVHQTTTEQAAVHGVALDGVLAVHEDPLRIMEPGERVSPGQSVSFNCPVSENATPVAGEIGPERPAVEWAGGVHFLCSGGHIHALRERALAAEGGAGGPAKPTGPVPFSRVTGVKSVLCIRVTFPDQWTDPQPEKECYEMMKEVNDFFVGNSHGSLHLMTTVTPLLIMPRAAAWYSAHDSSSADAILNDARATARTAGFDYSAYDLDAVRYSGAAGSFNGQAYIGARGVWLKSSSAGVAAHEFGHNLGLWHANFWNTAGESTIGSGSNSEYGNSFDTMGSANAGDYWFNAGHQNHLGWIPDSNTAYVSAGGLYRLHQFDQPRINPAARYLLRIGRDAERDYWCEFRQRWTGNAWLMNGVLMNWSPWGYSDAPDTPYGSNAGGQLLDTTPGSLDAKSDSPVVLGRTFSDAGAKIHITPVSKGGTSPESIDVMVQLGDFPGNRAPSLQVTATALMAPVNGILTFTAAALDPDGDPLAYSWDWGDRTFGVNAAVAEKSWDSSGLYTVRCEVSDMRGGTGSVLLPVTVGAPAQSRIAGRLETAEGVAVSGARVSCVKAGTSGTNRRLCLTDTDGNYLLSGLPNDSYTLTAVHEQFSMDAAFVSPVPIDGQDVTANFTAARRTAVAISLPDNSCQEGGDSAVLRFTRLADSNSGALTARLFVGGTSAMADVSFNPAATYELSTYTFTLPDGVPFLDVVVTAVNDNTAEGPETMSFHLVDGAGYIPSGPENVTLLIEDNDTSLPVVSLTAVDDAAMEGGDDAVLRLSRTGSVTAPIAINITRTGTAAVNTDYSGINTTVTIPSGSASVDIPITALPDSVVEGTEMATFSISSSASWIRSPLANAVSVQILDADLPVVTVIAADNDAAETNSDPAVFLFTRTGDTGTALIVDYALGGTAHHGTDFQPLSGTAVIPAGLIHAALVVTPVDDEFGEPLQTVTVQVRSTARYAAGEFFSASATIADNDLPHVMAIAADGSCDEGGGTGKFRIQSYGTGTESITVNYTLSGTAMEGTDFLPAGGSITVPHSGFAEITITPLQDEEPEDAESVILTLTPEASYTVSPERSAALTIVDDDQPQVSVTPEVGTGGETGGTLRFRFMRTGSTTNALTLRYDLTGDATPGADYTTPPGFLVIPAAASSAVLQLELLDDDVAEGSESVICSVVSSPGEYGAGGGPSSQWIQDSDESSLISAGFVSGTSSVLESAGTVDVEVKLSTPSLSEVTVDYRLNSGSAFNGVDYNAAGGSVVFAPGETRKSIRVTLLDDGYREPPETVEFRLLRALRARVSGTASHVLTIDDNDPAPPPAAGFTAAASAAGEGGGTPQGALVYLSAPQSAPVSLTWAVTGGTATAEDAAALSGTLTFQPGETVRAVPLPITDDSDLEPAESFVLTLSDPVAPLTLGSTVTHTVTVSDNDDTVITIFSDDNSAAEEGDSATFTVRRAALDITQFVTVQLNVGGSAAAGTDFNTLPLQLTIPAGATDVTLAIVPIDDALVDPDETIVLSIAASPFFATGTPSSAIVTILDNETGIAVSAPDPLAGEPDDAGQMVITRSGRTAGELIVPLSTGGSAIPNEDYAPLPTAAVFADGQTTVILNVVPVDDAAAEAPETIALTAAPGSGYVLTSPSAQITLLDDDANLPPTVAIVSPVTSGVILPQGPGLALHATVSDDGRPAPGSAPLMHWSALSGPGSVSFGDAGTARTTALFSVPGQYLLRFSAADAELSSSVDLGVLVLSDTLTGANIGHSSSLTGLSGGGAAWTLTGLGSTVSTSNSDSTYFAHRQMSGDFTIVARVVAIDSTNSSARCGVMVRSALSADARHAFMAVTPTRTSFVYRSTDGASGAVSNSNQQKSTPRYVRLRRTGDTFTAEHSTNGQTWTAQGNPQTIALTDPVFAGLVATSASSSATVAAVFDNFSITPAGNSGAFVHAGPSQVSGSTASLAGSVSDEGTPAVRWEKVIGPGTATLPAAASGAAHFDTPGAYVLRLFANDGEVETFADTTVQVTSPFTEWQTLHFGPDAGDPLVAGPRADPDHDGLENLAEFALTSDPVNPDANAAPLTSRNAAALSMTWREFSAPGNVTIQPQWSEDVSAWKGDELALETVSSGPGWTEKRATLDITARPRAVLRLLVTLPTP